MMVLAPHWTVIVTDVVDGQTKSWLAGPAVTFTAALAIGNAWRAAGYRFVREIRCMPDGYRPLT